MRAGRLLFLAALALASCAGPSERESSRKPGSGVTKTGEPEAMGRSAQAIGWSAGSIAPIRIRSQHTATLLGTNEVLIAGGVGPGAKTTEILRPFASESVPGPDLVNARSSHTATMLTTGKVLIAGGTADTDVALATAELYDPIARTLTATAPMAQPRAHHVALRLRSGKVLVTGGTNDKTTELYDPQAGTWSAGPTRVQSVGVGALATLADGRVVAIGPGPLPGTTEFLDADAASWNPVIQGVPPAQLTQTLTRLTDGRLASAWVAGCGSVGNTTTDCASFTSIVDFAPATPTTADGPKFPDQQGRNAFTAARTVEGNVLFIGGEPLEKARAVNQLDDTTATTLSVEGSALATHIFVTSTLIAGGDILVLGGEQAAVDRRVSPGAWTNPTNLTDLLDHRREKHSATRLHDGTILVAGGEQLTPTGTEPRADVTVAEIIDRAGKTIDPAPGSPSGRHLLGTLTTLRDGRALYAGGETNAVDIFSPGTGFAAGPPMAMPRTWHTATILPSGKVLVVGGAAESDGGAPAASEIFDPAKNAWTSGPVPANRWSRHGAVLLPNGLVLIVGGGAAELFDETKMAFRATTPPGATRDGRTAHLLANGKVFVAGGTTLAAEEFDPRRETWSYTSAQLDEAIDRQWTTTPSGKLVPSGGHFLTYGMASIARLFDPLAHPTGSFLELPVGPTDRWLHATALAGTGEVVISGGQPGFVVPIGDTLNSIAVYGDGALEDLRPTIGAVPLSVVAGTKVTITGSGFANGAEASDGTSRSSAANHPTAVWVSDQGDAVVPSTILDFSDTSATWLVPTTALYGHGLLFVNVAGVMSFGKSVAITPALAATSCENDAQCGTGFCTDGVCCDRRCDGVCEGCAKATKTSGEDGVCGAVPPGVGRCFLKLGDACNGGNECGTGFCAQGVCCDSTCDGQCLACNLQGKGGRCSAINEGACGAACDGDHTLKQIGNDDVDCAPYKCSGPQCNQTCASARDCVAPAVCSADGKCVPPVVPPAGTDTACGCRAAGGPSTSLGLVAFVAVALAFARRRRSDG